MNKERPQREAEDLERKTAASQSFGTHAGAYVDSPVHQSGWDLNRIEEWASGSNTALDIATGAGHTAGRIARSGEADVIAMDAAAQMVSTATNEYPNLKGLLGDAEAIPLQKGAVDLVSCRIAAHHFPNPSSFLQEVHRVLSPDGTFVFVDNIAPEHPEVDQFLNELERLRDPTHVRSHRQTTWESWCEAAGLEIQETATFKRRIVVEDWLAQLDVPADRRARIHDHLRSAPDKADEMFEFEWNDGAVRSFANLKLLLRATA